MNQKFWGGWQRVAGGGGAGSRPFCCRKAALGEEEVASAVISHSRRCYPCMKVTST